MNCVVNHINYSSGDDKGGLDDIGDNGDDDNNDNDNDKDGKLFWRWQFNPKKLL